MGDSESFWVFVNYVRNSNFKILLLSRRDYCVKECGKKRVDCAMSSAGLLKILVTLKLDAEE